MDYYAGIDVSLEYSSVCVVDASGKVVREAKVVSEPEALIGWFGSLGLELARIGLEAGPPAPRRLAAMKEGGPCGEGLGNRPVSGALKARTGEAGRNQTRQIAPTSRVR